MSEQTHGMAGDGIKGGRLARGMPLAGLAARQGAGRLAGKLTRDEQKKLDRFTREAERYVEVLGGMKGLAMKVGQLISFLDAGAIPEQHRAAYQQIVGSLQADAPPMPFDTVVGVLGRELPVDVEEAFERVDETPMAAASIGQVHAARLHDGRDVAVKVQYPGAADAIRADLDNTELIGSMARMAAKLSPIKVTADPATIAEEVTERIGEELDYRIEATNQSAFRQHYDGHPFIRIPAIVDGLSTERVLVMDLVHGHRWTRALEQDQERRDAWGEVVYRFVFGSLYDIGAFNADPHPGNYLFHDDGTVTFLDFGCVKRFADEQVDAMLRVSGAVFAGDDPQGLFDALQDMGCIPGKTKLEPERVFEWWAPIWHPGRGEQSPFTFTPDYAAWAMDRNIDPFGEWRDIARGMGISREAKDWAFLMRIQFGLYSVLGSLHATADWRAIHEELRIGAAPATDLGRAHAEWSASKAEAS